MKKEIPMPVIVAAIVLIVAVGGFFLLRAGNTQEFAPPKVEQTIPKYIFDQMSKADQDKMLADGIKVTDGAQGGPTGMPSGPGGPPPANIPGVPGPGNPPPGVTPPPTGG
jgi:hypothetical protein